MSDPISQINLWCQKHNKENPKYSYFGIGTNWVCHISASWLKENLLSENCTSKKNAKYQVAEKVLTIIGDINKEIIKINKPTIFLIDGDQRMDCWRWLASSNVSYVGESLDIYVFTSPTVCELETENKNIIVNKAKSTNRDSADALMLITLGRLLEKKAYERYVLISADHILVQAADDHNDEGVEWVSNLKMLKERFI